MTSRRDFLGIVAAAPFVAPVIAEAVAAPRYATGGLAEGVSLDTWVGRIAEKNLGEFTLTREQSIAFRAALDAPMVRSGPLAVLMRSLSPWEAPNRLHGAYINDDGDAV